ncbi:FadR family transcriptional regulator [Budviciaceae bacterium CWB-B4]|uniref:FadR family transcriptional regulator n=1 Tax=Limnobaculum xujianqingii TaxID=2738837 RepID=A0A9D7FX93_9GAMM|nr:FCD domain-containing protein [Limnobaculum xujianqingii]MBK5072677.1 FadR family transcriptional regulator [Limnobaculum xujianqingii]MBK5175986.1 FadR family transcriptional regulator [Limnobaculum xujianqingii]
MGSESVFFEKVRSHILEQATLGERIETETELAARFNVTRYQIRKVLTSLTQMGILDRSPKKGSVIRQINTDTLSDQMQIQFGAAGFDINEFLEARVLIECAILPLAIKRMTPALMGKLENTLNQMEEFAHIPSKADQFDRDFHLLILQACGNRVLQVFSDVLITYFDKTSALLNSFGAEYFVDIARQEKAILSAIKNEEVELAVKLLREHLVSTSQTLPPEGKPKAKRVGKKEVKG